MGSCAFVVDCIIHVLATHVPCEKHFCSELWFMKFSKTSRVTLVMSHNRVKVLKDEEDTGKDSGILKDPIATKSVGLIFTEAKLDSLELGGRCVGLISLLIFTCVAPIFSCSCLLSTWNHFNKTVIQHSFLVMPFTRENYDLVNEEGCKM